MRASIVVPARNEARRIAGTLAALAPLREAGHEVIVVDGGSDDATLALAAPHADRAFVALRGRARQMNAGAAAATGDVLLFLHADSRLPDGALPAIDIALARTRRRWGRFDVEIAGRSRWLPVVGAMMNARSRITGIATGDQGIFVERALFAAIGGYPDQPLMEDIELAKRLKRAAGPPACLRARIVTSGRRWEQHGTGRTIVAMWRWRYAYWRGVDPARLALRYGDAAGTTRVVLQVFAKDPTPGQVKTRLASAIGAEPAAKAYERLAERTLDTARAARDAGLVDEVELWCAPDPQSQAFARWRERYGVTLRAQTGDDLGARMRNALDAALAQCARPILIGTDCPALDLGYLARAVAALDDHDAVLGPAEDGGYVLIGASRPIDAFTGIAWSTAQVHMQTRAKLHAQGASFAELPTLWDVDGPADLQRWNALEAGAVL